MFVCSKFVLIVVKNVGYGGLFTVYLIMSLTLKMEDKLTFGSVLHQIMEDIGIKSQTVWSP